MVVLVSTKPKTTSVGLKVDAPTSLNKVPCRDTPGTVIVVIGFPVTTPWSRTSSFDIAGCFTAVAVRTGGRGGARFTQSKLPCRHFRPAVYHERLACTLSILMVVHLHCKDSSRDRCKVNCLDVVDRFLPVG